MKIVSPPTAMMRFTRVGVTSLGDILIVTSCCGETKTAMSPRLGLAYPGSEWLVKGMCGPNLSLLKKRRLHAAARNPEGLGEQLSSAEEDR